jgi:D-xylose transport system permease protein
MLTTEPSAGAGSIPAPSSGMSNLVRAFTRNLQSYMLVIALVVIWIGFGLKAPGYLTADHVQDILRQMAIIGIMACGMVFVIVTGGIDLSVGYGSGFVSVFCAWLLYHSYADAWVNALFPKASIPAHQAYAAVIVVVLGMLLGLLMGSLQGLVISRLSVPPFIVTLGGFSIYKSGILIVTQGKSLFISANDAYKSIAQGLLPPVIGFIIAVVVTVALFVRVFTARARKKKYAVALGSLPLELVKAAAFSALVFGYVLIVNRTFQKPPAQETAASDEASVPVGNVFNPVETSGGAVVAQPGSEPAADAATPQPDQAQPQQAPDQQENAQAAASDDSTPVEAVPLRKGVPVLVVILGVIALLMHYISRNTRFGRYSYAIGGNREAARLSGINIRNSIFMVYVTMGLLLGVSGIALAADVGSGTTSAGQGYELDVIASCILGGTSTLGGEGTVFGAVVGALIMQSLTNGLQMSNVSSNWHYLIKGLVLILAVYADTQFKKKRG